MIDTILAIMALAGFAGFLAVIGAFVPEPALIIVMVISFLMAAYDFLRDRLRNR